ncbi:MAG: Crp/Fnr family transcriptional regulator [Acidobacteria bacterium]|nr:Crp/Fnr family transcriptional regulator [Acidobacteriota bacterium]
MTDKDITEVTVARLRGLAMEFGVRDFFGCFDDKQLTQFAAACRFIEVSAGIKPRFRDMSAVPPHDVVCLILEGTFVVQESIERETVTLAIRSLGDFLNEIEALSGVGLSRSISPITDGLLISIPMPLFREAISANPLAKILGEMFANKLRADNLRGEIVSKKNHTLALAALVYRLSNPPFANTRFDADSGALTDIWTYELLQSYVGCRLNTLKEAIAKLTELNAIEIVWLPSLPKGPKRFKIKVTDMELLERFVKEIL